MRTSSLRVAARMPNLSAALADGFGPLLEQRKGRIERGDHLFANDKDTACVGLHGDRERESVLFFVFVAFDVELDSHLFLEAGGGCHLKEDRDGFVFVE